MSRDSTWVTARDVIERPHDLIYPTIMVEELSRNLSGSSHEAIHPIP